MSVYVRQVIAILTKDLRLELRTRERLAAMGAFAILAGVLFNFSIDTTVVRPQDVAAGLVWMTIVFGGLLGVGRTFALEAQDGAIQGILMSPAPKD
ncbi:MAG: heme exporter protein CcmB, partial [Gemmatimonadota bacterium]|nr:heme exporter protein CcmB [Gemmatimonadota bacterium]